MKAILSPAGVSEPSAPPGSLVELGNLQELGPQKRSKYHLGDTFPRLHHERLTAVIDDDNPDLPTIIRVDGAGRVDQRNTMPEGKAAAGPDLGLVSVGKRNGDAGRNQPALSGH